MKTYRIVQYAFLFLMISLSSCITNKKLNYLQPQEELNDTMSFVPAEATPYILRAGDELYIEVKPLYETGSRAFQSSGGKTSTQRMNSTSIYYYSYPIYEDGTIDYPYVGRINVGGLTMEEVREKIKTELSDYVGDLAITVKLASNYVTLMGEVNSPGRKQITTEKINVFDAIALGGDLDPYAKRSEIKVVRETKDGPIIKVIDLRSENIIASEYYWIQPGDIIIVSRVKGQFFKMDSFNDTISIFSAALSLVLLTLSLI